MHAGLLPWLLTMIIVEADPQESTHHIVVVGTYQYTNCLRMVRSNPMPAEKDEKI